MLSDGTLLSHRLLLAGVSPLLRRLLQEQEEEEETSCISLPDVSKHLMSLLLDLLTTGRAQLYQREVPALVALTHLLKLASIPVAVVAEEWARDVKDKERSEKRTLRQTNIKTVRWIERRNRVDTDSLK